MSNAFSAGFVSCLLYRMVSSLMNDPERECLCYREISINVKKLLIVLLHVLPFCHFFFILHFVVACLFVYPHLFILVLYFFEAYIEQIITVQQCVLMVSGFQLIWLLTLDIQNDRIVTLCGSDLN